MKFNLKKKQNKLIQSLKTGPRLVRVLIPGEEFDRVTLPDGKQRVRVLSMS